MDCNPSHCLKHCSCSCVLWCSLRAAHAELEARSLEAQRAAGEAAEARAHELATAEAQVESLREALGKLSQVGRSSDGLTRS